MNEIKGTKGKWVLECPKNSNGYMYISDKIGGYGNIATCYTVDYSEGDGNNITTVTKANALLISKAPEMLEMLQSFINDFDKGLIEDYQIPRDRFEKLIKEATEI